ncbi:extracellular catalytic domain type 1 short-chain-length polyhydroxyalkanoate depolymerase [Methylorubrum sp. SL192]|uniref:extracellular catalytic domain type 1 short-chain-length polyhydroxyalkanoate depolymerase n=1 Tax=Methylorubrum sp. SL192 TaxID=2995167 RepID=UPI001477D396|nr:PHB depolymerase family esterase [Methylorubrum sp. SL192]MCY1644989.1 PHB depolymerase family esterase [Methylorubrum sp. SL192]
MTLLADASTTMSGLAIGRPRALARRFGNAAGSRAYDLFVPSGYEGAPLPLVVMLHGSSQSSRDFAIGTGMDRVAEEQSFLVAYPDQPRSANLGKSWNWFRNGDQKRDEGEPSILAGLTREIMAKFNVDPARVYVAGLSSGGAAAAVMALAYPDIYAAVGIHSGLASGSAGSMSVAFSTMRRGALLRPRQATHPLPTIVFHGDRDTTVSPVNGDQAIAQAQPDGELNITTVEGRSDGGMAYTRTILIEPDGKWSSEQWVLHGGGHAWAGGHPSGSHTDPTGPDASREMLRFFMTHAKGDGAY